MFVGAQPGAGKSSTIDELRLRHPNAIAISGDDFRRHHPDYDRLRLTDPTRMPDLTAELSGPCVVRAIDEAIRRRVDVVVEGTYRDPETTFRTMRRFAEAGYRTELVTVATPLAVSQLSAVDRYLNAVRDGVEARWTPVGALSTGYQESAAILTAAREVDSCHSIAVYNRDGEELTRLERDEHGVWSDGADPERRCRVYRIEAEPDALQYAAAVQRSLDQAVELDQVGPQFDPAYSVLGRRVEELSASPAQQLAEAQHALDRAEQQLDAAREGARSEIGPREAQHDQEIAQWSGVQRTIAAALQAEQAAVAAEQRSISTDQRLAEHITSEPTKRADRQQWAGTETQLRQARLEAAREAGELMAARDIAASHVAAPRERWAELQDQAGAILADEQARRVQLRAEDEHDRAQAQQQLPALQQRFNYARATYDAVTEVHGPAAQNAARSIEHPAPARELPEPTTDLER